MPKLTNRLSARAVQTITKPGRHADGGNLYLNVSKAGTKSWVFMYRFDGRQREMGLGPVRDVPLARARELAGQHRRTLLEDKDPMASRERARALTFGECADRLIESRETAWRSDKHRAQWRMTLTTYAAPLRALRVDKITTADVLGVLEPIWATKPETASRLRGRIEAVLDWAKAREMRSGENPARWRGHLDHLMPKRTRLSRGHHAALPIDELPGFVAKLSQQESIGALALEFTILTAARTGEVIGARWSEFDLQRALWTVPAERTKAGVEHRVPLAPRAIGILEALAKIRDGEFVFLGQKRGQPLSSMAMEMLLRRMKVDATVHGFRSTFRDWASERTQFQNEAIEMALAHTIPNKVEAAYRRGELLEKRRELMLAWERFTKMASNVVPLGTVAA